MGKVELLECNVADQSSIELPDLVITLSAPESVTAGLAIGDTVGVSVGNWGTVAAPGTVAADGRVNPLGYLVEIVLSTDEVVPAGLAVFHPDFVEDVLLRGGRILSVTPGGGQWT